MDISKDYHEYMVGSLDRMLSNMADNDEDFSLLEGDGEHHKVINPYMASFIYMICREYVETHKGE